MRVLQINTLVNSGSHGRIAENIGKLVIEKGWENFIAFGRGKGTSLSSTLRIGGTFSTSMHVLKSRVLDRHGFGSYFETRSFLNQVTTLKPDLIHLHNIHGYYLHIGLLFKYLALLDIPVVWTLHDCWPFTGHCSHFEHVECYKWKEHCYSCPNIKGYPASWFLDRSRDNFSRKKELFTSVKNMEIVVPSSWLSELVKESFLSIYPVKIINNGVDTGVFRPAGNDYEIKRKLGISDEKIVLGVASIWAPHKGMNDIIELGRRLPRGVRVILVGLSRAQLKSLPKEIRGMERTESLGELVSLYSMADVFVNPTYLDNFPSTNIEALACGTPVVTYNTGGSPESVSGDVGRVVMKGDLDGFQNAVEELLKAGKTHIGPLCVKRADQLYNMYDRYNEYFQLYSHLLKAE